MTIDFLDRALFYMKQRTSFISTKSDVPEFTPEENKLLVRALYKLEKDGYIYTNTNSDDKGNKRVTFFISFDGLLALENSPFFWKNKPYRWQGFRQKLKVVWSITKIVAVIINAIIILVFTYLTYIKK